MDPLSGTASVIAVATVAVQLADGLRKLVSFWKLVQNAPAEISALFNDLESLSFTLGQAELDCKTDLDPIADLALRECQKKLLILCDKVSDDACGLDSSSFKRRKWSAFKISLDKPEIDTLRRAIERAQTTLILAKLISTQRSNLSHFAYQQQILHSISDKIEVLSESRDITYSAAFTNFNMQLLDDRPKLHSQGYRDGMSKNPIQDHASHANVTQKPTKPSPTRMKKQSEEISSWRCWRQTPLGSLSAWSTKSRATTYHSGRTKSYEEQSALYALYPSWLLSKFGLSYGLQIQARCTNGWQYTIQPFNAVPDDALIFAFCSEGNLAAVQTLLTRGEASLRDRDSRGWSPLWYATTSLELDVVEFLLQEGADVHATDWQTMRSAISAISHNQDSRVEKKIEMLHLFQQYADEFDETTMMSLVGLMLHFYRPFRELRLCALDETSREIAVLKFVEPLLRIWRPNEEQLTSMMHDIFLYRYGPTIIHWLLGIIKSSLAEGENFSIIHDAVRDKLPLKSPKTMKLLTLKTPDLHRVFAMTSRRSITPTELAMYQPNLFFAWRRIIKSIISIEEFIEAELAADSSPLAKQGWTIDSLTALFKMEESAIWESQCSGDKVQLKCERCGRYEQASSLVIDLQWRLFLRSLRKGVHGSATRLPDGKLVADYSGTKANVVHDLEERIVCSLVCLDNVCVAWEYDDEIRTQCEEKARILSRVCLDWIDKSEDCPTKGMPGAFVL